MAAPEPGIGPIASERLRPHELRDTEFDVVVLQRPGEIELLRNWTGLRAGIDVPAVYVEHNAPPDSATGSVHPLANRVDIPIVHVTGFNAVMWDCGRAPTTVIEHGIPDPGHLYTGRTERIAAVVNEPVRRWRVAGTDLLLAMADRVPLEVYGMGMPTLADLSPVLAGHLHDDVPQQAMHRHAGHSAGLFPPYRWTSLGLALIEAMTIGLPVLALPVTAAPESVPAEAGVLSTDLDVLAAAARRWLRRSGRGRSRGAQPVGRMHCADSDCNGSSRIGSTC